MARLPVGRPGALRQRLFRPAPRPGGVPDPQGLAYVDTQSPEQIAEMRGNFTTPGRDSPHRDRSVEENLALFADMRDNKFDEGAAVLRARIDMQSPNLNMRDPVLYRIRKKAHHQTGDKWVIYPMYDFTHPLSDALEGITHSLCTLEFEDHRPLYDWLVENVDVPAKAGPQSPASTSSPASI